MADDDKIELRKVDTDSDSGEDLPGVHTNIDPEEDGAEDLFAVIQLIQQKMAEGATEDELHEAVDNFCDSE